MNKSTNSELNNERSVLSYLIIADDLTGSCDAGLQMRRLGLPTRVQITTACALDPRIETLVLDTESRNVEEKEAISLVRLALASIDPKRVGRVIKKIDSTLRGNVVAEVLEVAARFEAETIVVAPSFPDQGRTVKEGMLYVHGMPLLKTEIGKDPIKAVTEGNLVTLFAGQKTYEVQSFDAKTETKGRHLYVCDATTDEDLRAIARHFASRDVRTLFVGSAGIAEALVSLRWEQKSALAVVASLSERTHIQVLELKKRSIPIIGVKVDDILLHKDLSAYLQSALGHLKSGRDVVLCTSSVLEPRSYQSEHTGLSESQIAWRIKTTLSTLTKQILDQVDLSGLFLTGGDMANGVLGELDVREVELEREVLQGIPLMKVVGSRYDGLRVITKAGAFGGDDAIAYALRVLKER